MGKALKNDSRGDSVRDRGIYNIPCGSAEKLK